MIWVKYRLTFFYRNFSKSGIKRAQAKQQQPQKETTKKNRKMEDRGKSKRKTKPTKRNEIFLEGGKIEQS